ncbi:MAG: glycosyltransferase family 2 protein [Candidatus Omnitrophota bacterium]
MYRDKRIALVIPAYKEEKLIKPTLESMPSVIDSVYVVDDKSPDNQNAVIMQCAKSDSRIQLIKHSVNQGPGAAIITGYKAAIKENFDIVVVVGGDNQMPLDELSRFLDPIVDDCADYVKGNRFMVKGNAFEDMPKIRLFGNTLISLMTKISSGYYHIFDVVDGYTAINKQALLAIDWDKAWKKYGYPMDFLMRFNIEGFRVIDVPRRAIYLPNERQSQIKGFSYALSVSPMLFRNFFYRMFYKYIFSNFHPLVFLFFFGMIFCLTGLGIGSYILFMKFFNNIIPSAGTTVICSLFVSIGIQSIFFAMFFDMQEGMGYGRSTLNLSTRRHYNK